MKSIVNYVERGNFGKNTYRGNCSGFLIKDLYNQFQFNNISDYSCGSGTVKDVAKSLNINSNCYDLNMGFDLIDDNIPEIKNEAIFYHPAYWDIIKYSGSVWGTEPIKNDISQIKDYREFIQTLNFTVLKQFSTLKIGGRMFVLVGDIKKKGQLYSMICDIVKPDTIENIVIKTQNNCFSNNTEYSNRNFIPIEHEYLLIFKRNNPYIEKLIISKEIEYDLRDSASVTWRDLIVAVFQSKMKKKLSVEEVLTELAHHKKAKTNNNVREKIRQVLQDERYFNRVEKGIYELC